MIWSEVSSNKYAADTLNSAMFFANLAWFRDQTPVIFISDTLQTFVFWYLVGRVSILIVYEQLRTEDKRDTVSLLWNSH